MLTWSQQFRHRARWWVSDPDLAASRILNLDICVDSYATRPWSGPCVSSPGDDHNHITWAAAGPNIDHLNAVAGDNLETDAANGTSR